MEPSIFKVNGLELEVIEKQAMKMLINFKEKYPFSPFCNLEYENVEVYMFPKCLNGHGRGVRGSQG